MRRPYLRLPFLHHAAAGLYATDRQVQRVDLYGFRGRVTRVRYVAEPVTNGDAGAALMRLAARTAPAGPVAAHLSPVVVRHAVRRGPAADDEESRAAWVQAQAETQLPAGARLDDFAVQAVDLAVDDEQATCLVALARRGAVEACRAGLDAAGLPPVRLGSADAEVGHALAWLDGFAAGRVAVLVLRAADACLVSYRDGILHALVPLAIGSTSPAALLDEVAPCVAVGAAGEEGAPARIYVVGEGAEVVGAALSARGTAVPVVAAPNVVLRQGRASLLLPAAYLLPAALAMGSFFPALGVVDFLGGTAAAAWRQEVERADALRVLLAAGSLVAVLLLVGTFASTVARTRLAQAEDALAGLSGRVVEVEQARAALAQLEVEVHQAERLVTERTGVAALLDGVGRAAPAALWLRAIRLAPGASGAPRVTIEGATLDESSLAAYLDRLERTPLLADVRLVASRATSMRVLYRDLPLDDRPLTTFEIALRLASGVPASGDGTSGDAASGNAAARAGPGRPER